MLKACLPLASGLCVRFGETRIVIHDVLHTRHAIFEELTLSTATRDHGGSDRQSCEQ
jgi:hypothetical protein